VGPGPSILKNLRVLELVEENVVVKLGFGCSIHRRLRARGNRKCFVQCADRPGAFIELGFLPPHQIMGQQVFACLSKNPLFLCLADLLGR